MLNPEQKMKDMFGFFKTSSIEPYRPGNPNRADEEDDRNNDPLSLLPHRGKAPEACYKLFEKLANEIKARRN